MDGNTPHAPDQDIYQLARLLDRIASATRSLGVLEAERDALLARLHAVITSTCYVQAGNFGPLLLFARYPDKLRVSLLPTVNAARLPHAYPVVAAPLSLSTEAA